MTTQVFIELPDPNHNRVKVTTQILRLDGIWVDALTEEMQKGERHHHYVYSGKRLVIEEIV